MKLNGDHKNCKQYMYIKIKPKELNSTIQRGTSSPAQLNMRQGLNDLKILAQDRFHWGEDNKMDLARDLAKQ